MMVATTRPHELNSLVWRATIGIMGTLVALSVPALILVWSDVRVMEGSRFTAADALEMEARIHAEWTERIREVEQILNEHLREAHPDGE